MVNISGATTLQELEYELARYGVTTVTLSMRHDLRGCCLHHLRYGFSHGIAATPADAIAEAFAELQRKMARDPATASSPARPSGTSTSGRA